VRPVQRRLSQSAITLRANSRRQLSAVAQNRVVPPQPMRKALGHRRRKGDRVLATKVAMGVAVSGTKSGGRRLIAE
jgi:hypothetical protein